ncbi:putative signal transducing protein [Wenyingzhuangia marina]|uniref:Putative signal transducing protein n=1 Tax=Wenyingzhuangia marina TaxID=1195760 RepID=A0A1M5V7Q4_9FLAO|nr:DUF2007 domain-containing protein [Wenyingzhuangia marina]GGF73865.1 hypothetical protein GCM10011397_15970 [Wenyingzhuangia marina]SHH71257.1 Putative signal transducing protein [Wenyingzhuangia marina]
MSLITIKTSNIEADLSILKSRLESEGIKCFIKNELSTQIMNYVPTLEMELQVESFELERVKKIMNEIENNAT